jgi:hypothetical protein
LESAALHPDVIDSDHGVGRGGIVDQPQHHRDHDNGDQQEDDGDHADDEAATASAMWCRGGCLFAWDCGV